MKLFDRLAEKFRRKQREQAKAEPLVMYEGRPQHGRGHPTTHSKALKRRRKAGRR